jgi:hypothetical protein
MARLNELTQEQIDAMPLYVDKWVKVGLSTERVDFERAKGLVAKAYEKAGLALPKVYHFARGPREGFAIYKSHPTGTGTYNDYTSGCMFGSQESSWLSYWDYYKSETCVEVDDLSYMKEIALHCGWVYTGDTDVIIHDRPEIIKRDENHALHCEDGPAIRYLDGYEFYSWHGQIIPKEWIVDRASLTPEIALGQRNTELRRAACEILGWVNVIERLNCRVIDQDADEMIGTLLEVHIPNIGNDSMLEKFLKVRCGTGAEFAIPVPPEMRTALEANAWTYGLKPTEYVPEVRT